MNFEISIYLPISLNEGLFLESRLRGPDADIEFVSGKEGSERGSEGGREVGRDGEKGEEERDDGKVWGRGVGTVSAGEDEDEEEVVISQEIDFFAGNINSFEKVSSYE